MHNHPFEKSRTKRHRQRGIFKTRPRQQQQGGDQMPQEPEMQNTSGVKNSPRIRAGRNFLSCGERDDSLPVLHVARRPEDDPWPQARKKMLDKRGGHFCIIRAVAIGLGPAKKQGRAAKHAKNDGQDSRNRHLARNP
jgi:hypothetical protein